MAIETATTTAPAHWAPYVINADASGFDYSSTPSNKAGDKDKDACDAWLASLGDWYVVSCEGEPYFAHTHDASRFSPLAGDVLEYVLHRQVAK
jgi:hypothetical protein